MTLVSRDAFAERLRALAIARLENGQEPVGLYAERELRSRKGVPHRLFKETRTKVKRAYGVGPQPVQQTRNYDPTVGSEGLIAQLVSELCKEQPKRFLNHPGPNAIRRKKVRRFILVTDFIGSGRRAWSYLEAAWRVRSVRSWWSARNKTGLRFEVIAYAAIPAGRAYVEGHPCGPTVHVITACPTIESAHPEEMRARVRGLCIRYDPGRRDPVAALGFEGGGALIAFAHGVPNNAPRILHKRSTRWAPLFPARVTSATRAHFAAEQDAATIVERLMRLRQKRLANATWLPNATAHAQYMLLVLAALSRPPRRDEAISLKTGLTIIEVQRFVAKATKVGWIDDARRLTDLGQAELAHARKTSIRKKTLQPSKEEFYYPTSLRAPSEVSS